MRKTHIDIGNGKALCGSTTPGMNLTSWGADQLIPRICKKCQHKMEKLFRGVMKANTVAKLLQAKHAVREALEE